MLLPNWSRRGVSAHAMQRPFGFVGDLASRLRNRVQLTSDGLKLYLDAVEDVFGADVDYAMLVKLYGKDSADSEKRYSPAKCLG